MGHAGQSSALGRERPRRPRCPQYRPSGPHMRRNAARGPSPDAFPYVSRPHELGSPACGDGGSRAAFEVGLRLAWIDAAHDQHEREIRVMCLHNDEARWKSAVASDYDLSGEGGSRWRHAAQAQSARVSRELDRMGWSGRLPRVASVTAQLHELDLDRLYSGYRLASDPNPRVACGADLQGCF